MGATLTADKVKVFRKDKEWSGGTFATYSIGVSSKDKDGNYINGYLDVQFRKGVELGNKAEIKIKNAFPVVRESNGKKYVSWFINEFDELSQGEAPTPMEVEVEDLPVANMNMGFVNVPDGDSDLPFAKPSR